MFLDVLRRRNPALIEQAIALHQAGRIPANSYVIDLDAVAANARAIAEAARPLGLKVFAMTKQMGRNGDFCASVRRGGIEAAVAVDMECARACHRAGLRIGHLGHLVQIPRAEADTAAGFAPEYWTVFDRDKARQASDAAARHGRRQALLARIQAPGDTFYTGHEGGFDADSELAEAADYIDGLAGARFAGITTFPALLFDVATRTVAPTHNLRTLERAAAALARGGRRGIEINAPGTTSVAVLAALAGAGATQVEPGHGLTGMTPLHATETLPEVPAVVYVTEVSHLHGGRGYCFGGGLYIDPVFPDYTPRAIVAAEPTTAATALMPVADSAARRHRLLRHDRWPGAPRRFRRVRLPAAGVRDARLHGRRLRPGHRRACRACGARFVGAADRLAGMTPPVLSLLHIRRVFGGNVALDDVTLDISAGEIVALVGDNGAGKSTLVKIIAGLLAPSAGRVLLDGAEARIASPTEAQARGIQVVHQDLALADSQPVYMNLFLGRELTRGPLRRLDRPRMMAETAELVRELDVRIPSVRAAIRDLSGGQRQGVAIARATHWASRLVLMDEPTAALGVAERESVERTIAGLRARNLAVLLISHSLDQVFRLADRICVLRRGVQVGVRRTAETSSNEIVAMITGAG